MSDADERPQAARIDWLSTPNKPQEYYDSIKQKFAEERDLRLKYRPEGTAQYTSDLEGPLADYEIDPYGGEITPREAINDTVECLFIGGGFSALLTSARLREYGVESIRIVERGADVGGTWYWNRYPGAACDVVAYDYLPLLDETGYVPTRHYAKGPEIFAYCQAIAKRYNLYELAIFQTTVTSTVWNEAEQMWHIEHRSRRPSEGEVRDLRQRHPLQAQAVEDQGHGDLQGPFLSHLAMGLRVHQAGPLGPGRQSSRHHRHRRIRGPGHSRPRRGVQGAVRIPAHAVIDRHPRRLADRPRVGAEPETRMAGQAARGSADGVQADGGSKGRRARACRCEEKIRRQENANIEYMMRIHRRIEEIVKDKATAESLKPWYMFMCKRPCFDNDYLPTYNRPNVHLVDTHGKGITEITEEGPVFEGKQYKLDVLIYATGFEVQKTGIYNEIRGQERPRTQ